MPPVFRRQIPNEFEALSGLSDALTEYLEAHAVQEDAVFALHLATEELITNIIKYGYDDEAPHEISLSLSLEDEFAILEIIDDGHEFNPFSIPPPDLTLPIEERPIGGLGLYFVKSLFDEAIYVREEKQNVVTVRKKLA